MTNQGDPNSPRRPDDYVDRAPSNSAGLIIGGLAVLGVLAFLMFGFSGDRSGDPVTPRSPGATVPTTAPPANKPVPAPVPATKPQ
jgi:hypothetical protein